jgi:mannose-6-phosphate isomerase
VFAIVGNTLHYSWGSTSAIPELLGVTPSGEPHAELWLGDHPVNPSRVTSTGQSLIEWGRENPDRFGGEPLPFLLKILAAQTPLSIQAHPTRDQARQGWERENAAGIPIDSPTRNYRDANHKPEVIIALSTFSALCGFRPAAQRSAVLDFLEHSGLTEIRTLRDHLAGGLNHVVEWLLRHETGVDELLTALATFTATTDDDVINSAVETAVDLARSFPGDPGAGVSLLLNRVNLQPGEALFLPAGNIHAYLHGVGVEVMATSDNVLRGGLTNKHIDVPELLSVLDFRELAEPRLFPQVSGSVTTFSPGLDDFSVTEVVARGRVELSVSGPAIAIVTDGALVVSADTEMSVTRGEALFVEAGETITALTGDGQIFIAH